MSDVRVKRGTELSTDHHLVVYTLKALKPLKKRDTFRPRETYRIKWESLADKEVRTAFADNIVSNFKELPTLLKTLKLSGVCFEQQSSRPLLTVVDVSVLEGRRVVRKELLGGTKKLKKLFVRKVAYKAWLANKSSLELRSQYSEARKAAATKVKLSKERAWKEFGERLNDDFKTAKCSDKPFAVCVEKDLKPLSLSKIQMV